MRSHKYLILLIFTVFFQMGWAADADWLPHVSPPPKPKCERTLGLSGELSQAEFESIEALVKEGNPKFVKEAQLVFKLSDENAIRLHDEIGLPNKWLSSYQGKTYYVVQTQEAAAEHEGRFSRLLEQLNLSKRTQIARVNNRYYTISEFISGINYMQIIAATITSTREKQDRSVLWINKNLNADFKSGEYLEAMIYTIEIILNDPEIWSEVDRVLKILTDAKINAQDFQVVFNPLGSNPQEKVRVVDTEMYTMVQLPIELEGQEEHGQLMKQWLTHRLEALKKQRH